MLDRFQVSGVTGISLYKTEIPLPNQFTERFYAPRRGR